MQTFKNVSHSQDLLFYNNSVIAENLHTVFVNFCATTCTTS